MPSTSDEDDDLEFLRSAALASLGKKASTNHHSETDDLDALRRQALTSRRNRNPSEDTFFEKLKPAKGSNLINLTPDPNKENSKHVSESENKLRTPSASPSESESESESSEDDQSSSSVSPSRKEVEFFLEEIQTAKSQTKKRPNRAAILSCCHHKSTNSEESSKPSDDSSSSSTDESDSEREQKSAKPKKKVTEEKEEDDLLNAIDQFLDEGVMMLEEAITPAPSENTKPKKTKSKRNEKETRKKDNISQKDEKPKKGLSKSKIASSKKDSESVRRDKRVDKKQENPVKKKLEKLPDVKKKIKVTTDDMQTVPIHSNRMEDRNEEAVWQSGDLPLDRSKMENFPKRPKPNVETDSVHSSDLSFLSDAGSINEEKAKAPEKKQVVQPKSKFIRVNRHRIDEMREQREYEMSRTFGNERTNNRFGNRPYEPLESKQRDDSDLRDKLRRRGLHRPVTSQYSEHVSPEIRNMDRDAENGHAKLQVNKRSKIYVKPSVVYESNGNLKRSTVRGEDAGRFVVTRKLRERSFSPITVRVAEGHPEEKKEEKPSKSFRKLRESSFSPITVRVAEGHPEEKKEEKPSKSFRRKRSVVQFTPDSTEMEKKKKVEMIQKEIESEKQNTNYFSDLSENFDDFEIGEPDESTIIETAKNTSINKEKNSSKDARPDTRRFISAARVKHKKDESSSGSISEDESPAKKFTAKSAIRKRLGKPADVIHDAEEEPLRVRSKIKPIRDNNSRDRRANDRYPSDGPAKHGRDVPLRQRHHREAPVDHSRERDAHFNNRNSSLSSRSNWHRDEKGREFGRRDDRQERRRESPERNDSNYRRKRRVDVSVKNVSARDEQPEEHLSYRPVKHRLGFGRDPSPLDERRNHFSNRTRERRKYEEGRERFPNADREKEVDDRIRRINEQNSKIKKRRELVELEERKHRLKST